MTTVGGTGMCWEERGGEMWLTVDSTAGILLEDVVREADAAGHVDLDVDAVAAVLTGGGPRPVARADRDAAPGRVRVTVAEDGMTATLHVEPPGPKAAAPLCLADVELALEIAGVRLGLDRVLLDSLPLDRPGEYLVANGWPAVAGRDGHVEFVVSATHEVRPHARRDGGVDLRAVATIADVQAGDLLAVLVDPGTGTPGRTVRGEPIAARPGTPAALPTGANVTVSDDGRRLYAAIDGLLEMQAGQVSVRPDLLIPGDIDFTTGSIVFRGDVVVRGSVKPGFRVVAGGRVVVMGDVEQAEVTAGDLVWVRGAVVGERSVIRAGAMVKARVVRDARIEARSTVFVEREVQDAAILGGTTVVLEAPRNRVVGGVIRAGRELVVGELGSLAEEATRVVVGIDPFAAEEIEKLEAERAEHVRTVERVGRAISPFRQHPELLDRVDDRRRRAIRKLFAAEASLEGRLAEVTERLAQLEPADDGIRPRIVVRHALRPGVVLQIRRAVLRNRTTQFRVAAIETDRRISLVPLSGEVLR